MSTARQPVYSDSSNHGKSRGRAALFLATCFLVLTVAMCAWAVMYSKQHESAATVFPTPYQAVLLANGAVYFGKLEGYGTAHPILTNAFYIVNETNPLTKQVSNVLVKRGKELHGPDRMYLTPNQIIFVETVGPNSKVAQLIAESPN